MRTVVLLVLLGASAAAADTPAVALHDFESREPDELSFRRGDRLTVIAVEADGEEGWGRAWHADGRVGLLPLNYVRMEPSTAGSNAGGDLVSGVPTRVEGSGSVPKAAADVHGVGPASAAWADDIYGALDSGVLDETPAQAALRAYRSRRALYNGGDSALLQRWGVRSSDALELASNRAAPPALATEQEHRSGVGGVPFFNLIEHMDEMTLAREVVGLLRAEWYPEYGEYDAQGALPGLERALRTAAGEASRDVILTFSNLGYADFVLNGFRRDVVPNTLVIALDEKAHERFVGAGLISFFDGRMPRADLSASNHRTAAFMDIMKLRLLYATEALQLGFNILLTDADAVFAAQPFSVFPPSADLVVACDSTVVPLDWRQAPGMVMAGFFYARAGVRPIIFLKEVLDYQLHHPEQHDQQSFNQILSELLVADVSVAVMHPRLFPNGFQYFVKRTVQREGGTPLVVQNNWMMGAENKRHRFREAALWSQDPPAYFTGTADRPLRLLRYQPEQPFVSGLLRETSALRAAFRIATLLNRTLVLPTLCAFTSSSGLVPPPPLEYRDRLGALDTNVLDDTVDGDWCTAEWYYDMQAMRTEFEYRESTFVDDPRVPAAVLSTSGLPPFFIEASNAWQRVPPPEGATRLRPADVSRGATDEEVLTWLAPHAAVPTIILGDLAGRLAEAEAVGQTVAAAASTSASAATSNSNSASAAASTSTPASASAAAFAPASAVELSARLARGLVFREEIMRHVQQQVQTASPFECLCLQNIANAAGEIQTNLTSIVLDFASRAPVDSTVFVAGYRVDLVGIEMFHEIWNRVFALALCVAPRCHSLPAPQGVLADYRPQASLRIRLAQVRLERVGAAGSPVLISHQQADLQRGYACALETLSRAEAVRMPLTRQLPCGVAATVCITGNHSVSHRKGSGKGPGDEFKVSARCAVLYASSDPIGVERCHYGATGYICHLSY